MGERFYRCWPFDRNGKVENIFYVMEHSDPMPYQQLSTLSPTTALYSNFNNFSEAGNAERLRLNKTGSQVHSLYVGDGQVQNASEPLSFSSHLNLHQYVRTTANSTFNSRNRYIPYYNNRSYSASTTGFPIASTPLINHAHIQDQQGAASYQTIVPYYQTASHCAQQQTTLASVAPIVESTTCSKAGITSHNIKMNMIPPNELLPCTRSTTTAVTIQRSSGEDDGDKEGHTFAKITEMSDAVTLQITNLDYSLDESHIRSFLLNQLKPITPVVSLVFEGSSYAKVTVPDLYFAKQVVSNLHRKKIGHKRMLVSYTRDSSLTEVNTLRCQVAGLLKVYNDGGIQCIRLTRFMKFIIAIVRMLEQRPSMYLYEIKNGLNCGLSTTFEFGFPNLYSVIAAHKDLFRINNGPTQERSEVSINMNCELRQSSLSKDQYVLESQKLTNSKHRAQRSFHSHFGEHNGLPISQPPLKRNATINNCSTFQAHHVDNNIFHLPANCFPPRNNLSLPNSFGSVESGSFSNSYSNKENSMKSLQLFNSSFNSSDELNASLGAGDLTNISAGTAIAVDTSNEPSELWRRRQQNFNHPNPSNYPKSENGTDCPYIMGNYSAPPIGYIYEPLKFDGQAKEKLPFWIDPIWSKGSEQLRHDILNIRLPKAKTTKTFSNILSPYTISKNENLKRQLFSFDNHDRKIA
ncbi:uncharacterized protein LOC6621036 isoform X4 [Drosophila sechellia]|uniref:uncharacterized protein LOC6621036 isoform X4 n=1 Tax=Drosophila sechellia TaxID=7238 RepID=UPI0013DE7829|nr:uncharacterized protein LOC6621036 isoform X4 [Drosophila sechellia]